MKILAFDTSGSGISVAITEDNVLLSKSIIKNDKQSEILISEFEEILTKNNLWYNQLDAIAATSGPGSFTGVRVGLSAARTLKIATKLPLILISSLEVIAFKYRKYQGQILVAIDAKMNEFFIGKFDCNNFEIKQIGEFEIANLENIKKFLPKEKFLLCGNAKNEVIKNVTDIEFDFEQQEDEIEPELLAKLAYEKIISNNSQENLDAIYLRQPKITARKRKETKI